MLTKIVRGTFPAAMIVVCASIYFVYFDSPRAPSNLNGSASTEAARAKALQEAIVAESALPPELKPELPVHSASTNVAGAAALPLDPSIPLPVPSLDESLSLELPTIRTDDETAEPMPTEIAAPALPIAVASSAPANDIVASAEQVSDLPDAQESVISNTQYGSTRVNDYWVGLERARTAAPTSPEPRSGVILNPYHQPGASSGQIQPVVSNESSTPTASVSPTISQPFFMESEAATPSAVPPVQEQAAARELPISTDPAPIMPIPLEQEEQPVSVVEGSPSHTSSGPRESQAPSVPALPPLGDHVRQRLIEHWEYGGSLARRNAVQLARQEFFSGLTLLAEHADQHEPGANRLQALREGFLALEELRDFAPSSELKQANLLVLVQKHETPLIRDGHFQTDSHAQARQAYLLYAKERLGTALGSQPLAAELLYSCGKLHLATYEYNRSTDNLDLNCARTLFECARLSDPTHAKSCNELAVIQAKERNWTMAKSLLQQAVGRQPQFIEAWQNLSKVHRQLGEVELAELATAQVAYLSDGNSTDSAVRMVSNSEFASIAAAMDGNMEFSEQQPEANGQSPAAPVRFGGQVNSGR
ncbi:MAG: hypothetical protein JNL67_03040 [Planctomycetaceae bacterium]|nr:hypothetical protein [Planctomycetaceae bacterium]